MGSIKVRGLGKLSYNKTNQIKDKTIEKFAFNVLFGGDEVDD